MGRAVLQLLKETVVSWHRDRATRMAAALAFYTVFSLAPLLVIAIAIAGFVFTREAVQQRIEGQVQDFVGAKGAEVVREMIAQAGRPSSGIVATLISIFILLFGATRFFAQLQSAMDTIWKVQPKPGLGLKATLYKRFISICMVLGTGLLVLGFLLLTAALSTVLRYVQAWLGGLDAAVFVLNLLAGFIVTASVFAVIFKVLPATRVKWGDVWVGALGTTLLFSIGRYLLGLYLGWGIFHSVYGAAGSIVIILFWVYYSAQILLLGAEFTHAWAKTYGSRKPPPEKPAEEAP
ncbi:MAG: YihY/virulence factor BrkB family protein [Planctomycetota bacterium]